MLVDLIRQNTLHQRQNILGEGCAPSHPLIVRPTPMVVRTIKTRAWKEGLEPVKHRLVACVHTQSYLRLLPVSAKVSLTDQQPRDETPLKVGYAVRTVVGHQDSVSPSRKT